jgi:hypothetical protein
VGGSLEDQRGWTDQDGVSSEAHGRSSTLFGRLTLGTPVLNATLGVDRREQQTFPATTSFITDSYAADAVWRPSELPELHLRLAHQDGYDSLRLLHDDSTDTAQLSTRYGTGGFEIRYLADWLRSTDHIHGVQSTSVDQTAIVTDASSFLDGRATTYLSGTLQRRDLSTLSAGQGGVVVRKQLPVAGLSAVVALPATSDNVALANNPALIDGNTGASAAVNLGWSVGTLNDTNPREVGAQFPDAVTDVNLLYLWTDRPLTGVVATTIKNSIQVRTSTDNQHWSAPVTATATVSPIQNRIEIGISQLHAKYVKVTIQPLPLGVTTDPAFRDIFVTELEFQLVLPVSAVPRSASSMYASGTAVVRAILLRQPELTYDFSGNVTHQTEPSRSTYALSNGLSVHGNPRPGLSATARGARVDTNDGVKHEGQWEWSAGLGGRPLPTASWALTYNGRITDDDKLENSGTAFARAEWWEGIASQASGTGSISAQGLRVSRSVQANGSTSFAPNPRVALTVGALYSRTMLSDPEIGETWSQFARVDGTLSLTPGPAFSMTATLSRVVIAIQPTTYGTLNVNYAPFRGDVQLTLAYSETLDTAAQYRTRSFTPSLRWNIRGGTFLTASYALVKTSAPVQATDSRAFMTTLLVVL